MSLLIHPGFMGHASVAGWPQVRCTDFSVNVKQEPIFYDHTIGLRDSISTNIYDVKGDDDSHNPQKIFWRPGVKLAQGIFGFPWTTNNLGVLLNQAIYGDDFDMSFYYTCGIGRRFKNCKVNSYSLKLTNGDFVSSTVDIMTPHMEVDDVLNLTPVISTEKLVTWDSVVITGLPNAIAEVVSFDLTINNGVLPIYTAGQNNSGDKLEPKELRVGMQMVSGSVSYYTYNNLVFMENISTSTSVGITIGSYQTINLKLVFKPMEQSAATGAVIRTVPFVGVDKAIT